MVVLHKAEESLLLYGLYSNVTAKRKGYGSVNYCIIETESKDPQNKIKSCDLALMTM